MYVANGWTWAEACYLIDLDTDIRKYDSSRLLPRMESDLGDL